MPPPLGSPLEKLTRRMFTRIIAAVARTVQDHDLDVAQLAVLYLLDERGLGDLRERVARESRGLRVGDIATELGRSLPTASRLVDDLVRQKLVDRKEDPSDRRARILTLAPKGRAFVAKSSEARMATIAGVAADVPMDAIQALWSLGRSSDDERKKR